MQRQQVADELQDFYDKAAGLIDHSIGNEAVPMNGRLVRTLRSMGRTIQADGKVEFRSDADAEHFVEELQRRYGEGVIAKLATGRTDAIARDIEEADQRVWIARAVISAAKSHVAIGLTLREARDAEWKLAGLPDRDEGRDWER